MQYRTVEGKVTQSNFTPEEHMRYSHNLNMMHRRLPNMRATETMLYPVDITEDDDEEPGYVTGFDLRVYKGGEGITLSEGDQTRLNAIAERARAVQGWLIADLEMTTRYRDLTLPVEWVRRITPYILEHGQYIENGFLIEPIRTYCPVYPIVRTKNRPPLKDGSNSKPLLDDLESDSEEDGGIENIFVTDQQKGDPRRSCSESYIRFLDTLHRLYQEGTIGGVDQQFIDAWELEEDKQYKGLYHSLWTNTLVAPDKSEYLMRVLAEGKPESYRDEVANPVFDFYGRNRCVF